MNKAKKEIERLARVNAYGVLDTEFERGYDDLVKLAATICETSSAAISLVDESRIWFKARFQVKSSFVPRSTSICGITVERGSLLCIPDLLADPRTAELPYVAGAPQHRAYLGLPLLTPDGYVIGTLAVLDNKARPFTPAQVEALAAIARQVMTQLDLSAANRKLALSQEKLNEERERFKNIVEDLNEVVFRADTDGKWVYLNPAWAHHLGYDPQAAIGESMLAHVHPADQAAFRVKLGEVIAGSTPSMRPQARLLTVLGEEKIFEIFVKRCQASNGSFFLAGTLTDLTQLLSAHAKSIEQEHYINSFYSSTGFFMGVVELTANDITMISGNPALQKIMLRDSSLKFPASGTALGMDRATIDFWREKYRLCLEAGGRSSFDYQEAGTHWFRVYLGQVESQPNGVPRFSYIVTDVNEEVTRQRTLDTQRNLLETIS
ncbi:MAG: PAS domain S-box protein, partial [Proteobacteria bacterium]